MLPKIKKQTNKYITPITNTEINISKLTLKEQKLIKSINDNNMFEVIVKIIESCTDVSASKLSIIEISWVFLQIRRESISNDVKISAKCSNCGVDNETTIDLSKFDVTQPEVLDPHVTITKDLGLYLKIPSIMDVVNSGSSEENMIRSVIDYIYNDVDVYKLENATDAEVKEFIESLPMDKLALIIDWIKNTGSISIKHEWDCPSCKHHNSINSEGIKEFVS